jgi:hypothetical protein
MTAPAPDPDKADVQRLIVYTYDLRRSRHFVLQVKDPAKARSFIWSLVNERFIANASVDHEAVTRLNDDGFCPTHIGFTFRGLEKLELDVPYLRVFQEKAKAFAEGAVPRAARRLADVGSSAAPSWDPRFAQDDAHVLLCTYADEESERPARCSRRSQGVGSPLQGPLSHHRRGHEGRAFRIPRRHFQPSHTRVSQLEVRAEAARTGRVSAGLPERQPIQSLAAGQSVAEAQSLVAAAESCLPAPRILQKRQLCRIPADAAGRG